MSAKKRELDAMPCDLKTEQAVLSVIIEYDGQYEQVSDILTDDCFYYDENKAIFKCFKDLVKDGIPVTMMTVADAVKKYESIAVVEPYKVAQICAMRISTYGFERHVAILSELSAKRKIALLGMMLKEGGLGNDKDSIELLEMANKSIEEISTRGNNGDMLTLNSIVEELNDIMSKNQAGDGTDTGQTLTGFSFLDSKGGFRPADLVIIGGDSSQGKTSFANTICMNAIMKDKKVAYFTMEMRPPELVARLISMSSGISSNRLLYGKLSREELCLADDVIGRIQKFGNNLFIDGRQTSNAEAVVGAIFAMKQKYDIDGVIVDYIQIFTSNGARSRNASEESELAEIARRFKIVATRLGIWVCVLSQMNRGAAGDEPMAYNIRGSGQILEASDIALLIYRPETYGKRYHAPFADVDPSGTALIKLAKGRNIGTGQFICGFDGATTRFFELDEIPRVSEEYATPSPQQKSRTSIPF